MVFGRPIAPILIAMLQAIILFVGCGNQPADDPENKNTKEITRDFSQENDDSENPDWGSEVNLDEMIAMARKGEIVEIQWHVMPNVLRAQAADGKIYHLKNESKGVDLRNTLLKSGVTIGKGGVLFRHVF